MKLIKINTDHYVVVDDSEIQVDEMIASQNHENFFESRATSYAKGALTGSWGSVWGQYK